MGIPQSISFFVTDSFEELVDPDGGIDRETLLIECFDLYRASTRLNDGPEPRDPHGESLCRMSGTMKDMTEATFHYTCLTRTVPAREVPEPNGCWKDSHFIMMRTSTARLQHCHGRYKDTTVAYGIKRRAVDDGVIDRALAGINYFSMVF